MAIDKARTAAQLKAFDFPKLFIEELGLDRPKSRQAESIDADGGPYALVPVAEKRGFRVFHYASIPDRNTRQRIDREITKRAYEHLIIFTDPERSRQVWQWVAREKGKPAAFREHVWLASAAPDALLQKLAHISFTLDEENDLTLAGVTHRMRDAFDREQISRRFYTAFKEQHDRFLGFITGLQSATDKQWYASLMLNRLMFVYFIQKKAFLDGDINYLKNRLATVRKEKGADQFHSFYRAFLLTLFHGGLATPKDSRDAATTKLLGNIPYLNGGLFEPHALEATGNTIQIADDAFEGVFAFFDQYEWTLDTRAIERADGREINPDVLGHIFEKYINQKQMGAYYTKEDITDYITKNTVIPWLFQNAVTHDKVAFEAGSSIWRMLSESPDTYIYPAVKKGTELPLPDNIAAGIDDVSKRGDWNKTATQDFGLPTEIWREVVARRERYTAIKAKAASGEIATIENFITYNLDIRQFARDAIQYAESPDIVKAFWKGISSIKVLDPACGSGAFLFAALTILYDLYDACLERMQQFVDAAPPARGPYPMFKEFREVLAQVERHPNRPYFIYKSIIIANLYGVDIMDEAVEICKLRLFLKLAAQLERADQIEPLPDIDFNIRAGNSLIGYTSLADVKKASTAAGFSFDDGVKAIEAAAQDAGAAQAHFRKQQTELDGAVTPADKAALRQRLAVLQTKLDLYLARDYGQRITDDKPNMPATFAAWKASHKPFHWWAEFYGIIEAGGFDVAVGNPPYVKASEVRADYAIRGYATDRCADMYAWIMERAATLTSGKGMYGMIVPLSLTFSSSFQPLRDYLIKNFSGNWFSSFARIPAALFSADVRVRNTIYIGQRTGVRRYNTTITHRWFEEARPYLIERLEYGAFDPNIWNGLIPKLGSTVLLGALEDAKRKHTSLDIRLSSTPTGFPLHFKQAAYNWVSFGYDEPPSYAGSGERVPQTKVGKIYTKNATDRAIIHTLLNGKIAFLWWCIVGDDFDVTKKDFEYFPILKSIEPEDQVRLSELSARIDIEMNRNIVYKLNAGKRVGNYNLAQCRSITDESDAVWFRLLGLDSNVDNVELAYYQIVKTSFEEKVQEE